MNMKMPLNTGILAALSIVLALSADVTPSAGVDHCIQKTRWSLWATKRQ